MQVEKGDFKARTTNSRGSAFGGEGVGRLRGFSACGIGCLTSYFAFQKALAASLQPQFERPQRDPGGHTSRTTRYAAVD